MHKMETLNLKRNNKVDKGCNASGGHNNNNNNNNVSNNANQLAAKAEREEKVRTAVAAFIIRERQRKKEEFEAKVEEVRQRKEREARERQNAMTLEETRAQINKLEKRLFELHNQKQQLFLQLKKVLNEDEIRKKQQKDNEIMAMQAAQQAQQATIPQPEVFLQPVRVPHHQMPIITKTVNNPPIKRGRSPSPTQQNYYKNATYAQPKYDENRRGIDYARVLWNKPHTTYQSPGTLFYQTTSNAPPPPQQTPDARNSAIIYTPYNLPLRQGYHLELPCTSAGPVPTKADQKTTYIVQTTSGSNIVQATAPPPIQQKPQITMEKISDRYHHVDVKHEGPTGHCPPPPPTHQLPEDVVYIPGMALHPNVMQIGGGPLSQNPKAVGVALSQGYVPQPPPSSRGSAIPHDTQLSRQQQQQQQQQQQLTIIAGQPVGQAQQPIHYPRRMF